MAQVVIEGIPFALPGDDSVGSKVPLYNEALIAMAAGTGVPGGIAGAGIAVMTAGLATVARGTMTATGGAIGFPLTPMTGPFYCLVTDDVGFTINSADGGDAGNILWVAYDDLTVGLSSIVRTEGSASNVLVAGVATHIVSAAATPTSLIYPDGIDATITSRLRAINKAVGSFDVVGDNESDYGIFGYTLYNP